MSSTTKRTQYADMDVTYIEITVRVDVDSSRPGMGQNIYRVKGEAEWSDLSRSFDPGSCRAELVGYVSADGEETRWDEKHLREMHTNLPNIWSAYWERGQAAIQVALDDLMEGGAQ